MQRDVQHAVQKAAGASGGGTSTVVGTEGLSSPTPFGAVTLLGVVATLAFFLSWAGVG